MKELLLYTFRKFVDYWTRIKTFPRILLGFAAFILVSIFGGPSIELLVFQIVNGSIPEDYKGLTELADAITYWILALCSLMIFTAIIMAFYDNRKQLKRDQKKRVIILEGRGLRDDDGSPLLEAIDKSIEGQRIPLLLDLRQKLDGKIVTPQMMLDKIAIMHGALQQHKDAIDRSDLTIVYGGLTSVPFTFLTGILLDDEGKIVTMDWDRAKEGWRALGGEDDNKTFTVEGIDNLTSETDAVLAVSCSYPIRNSDIHSTFAAPIIRMTLDGASSDAHWSADKQQRLATQFLETIKQLDEKGITTIHLVIAAPNSLVFNLGRRYDKRNLPEIIVYQYERGSSPAYPWGVNMPVEANTVATLTQFKSQE